MDATVENPANEKSVIMKWTLLLFGFGIWTYTFRVLGFAVLATFSGIGLDDTVAIYTIMTHYAVQAVGICLIPFILDKTGITLDPKRNKRIMGSLPIAAFILIILWFTAFFCGWYNLYIHAAVYCLIAIAPAIGLGLALRRVVLLWKTENAGVYIGAMYTAYYLIIFTADKLLAMDYTLLYLLMAAVVLLTLMISTFVIRIKLKDDFTLIKSAPSVFISDELMRSIVVLLAMFCLYSSLIMTGFYFDTLPNNLSSKLIYDGVSALSLIVMTILLKKQRWLVTITACMLFLCFSQGLLLYPIKGDALAIAYCLMNAAGSFPLIIAIYAFPVALCTARRKAGFFVAFGFGLLDLMESFIKVTLLYPDAIASFPAILLPLGLIMVGLLFYIYISYQKNHTQRLLAAVKEGHVQQKSPRETLEAMALTPRERELAGLLLSGEAQKNIAAQMGISYSTVKFHSNNLYRKLNIQSRVELFSLFALPVPLENEEDK